MVKFGISCLEIQFFWVETKRNG